jgi:hypothetical protein
MLVALGVLGWTARSLFTAGSRMDVRETPDGLRLSRHERGAAVSATTGDSTEVPVDATVQVRRRNFDVRPIVPVGP